MQLIQEEMSNPDHTSGEPVVINVSPFPKSSVGSPPAPTPLGFQGRLWSRGDPQWLGLRHLWNQLIEHPCPMDVLCTCTVRVYRADKEGLPLLLLPPPLLLLPLLPLSLPPPLLLLLLPLLLITQEVTLGERADPARMKRHPWLHRTSMRNTCGLPMMSFQERITWCKKNCSECGQHYFINWGAQTKENGKKQKDGWVLEFYLLCFLFYQDVHKQPHGPATTALSYSCPHDLPTI